jgi:hypothetical protein
MGRQLALCAVVMLAACGSMYGAPAERLHPLPPKPPPKVTPVATEPIAYVEDCDFDFHRKPVPAPHAADTRLDEAGGAQLERADHAAVTSAKVDVLEDAITTYSRALASNPYDPDATLGLARAYDGVQRKGCALALLKRLGALADHSKFASAAVPVASSVSAHRTWFKGYRREALSAVGRP